MMQRSLSFNLRLSGLLLLQQIASKLLTFDIDVGFFLPFSLSITTKMWPLSTYLLKLSTQKYQSDHHSRSQTLNLMPFSADNLH